MERLVPNSSIRQRKAISASEHPFLEAIVRIVAEHEPYWPISLRRVHYSLLNQPVVRNAKSGALYANDYLVGRAAFLILGIVIPCLFKKLVVNNKSELAPTMSPKEAAIAFGILTDKMLLLQGEATSIVMNKEDTTSHQSFNDLLAALPKAQANVIEAETSEIPPPKNSNPTLP